MVARTLMIKALKQQLRRRLFWSTMDLCLVVVLLSAISILVTCKQCSVKEVQNQLAFQVSKSYRSNFDNSSDISNDIVGSELVSSPSVRQHSLENICPPSDTFCFPSTLSNLVDNEISAETEAGVCSKGISSGLKQMGSFQSLDGKIISCSLYQEDGFQEFSSDVSSCVSPAFDRKTSKSVDDNIETVKVSFPDEFATLQVEIKPSVLDWGNKNMYNPSLAFLSVKNVDADSVLSVYDPYSSDSQLFYPCNFSELSLAPGDSASICFVFFPAQLGLSSAQIVLQTSFGGFLIKAKGFAVESPYLIKPLTGLDPDISSNGRWRNNLSLFNPFDEALYVDEIISWISTSSGNTSNSICHTHTMKDTSKKHSMLSDEDWFVVARDKDGRPIIALRPQKNWEISPKKTETIVELDISPQYEGKVAAVYCMRLVRSLNGEIDTVLVPFEAELQPINAPDTGQVSLSMEALVPCSKSGSIVVALFVRNDAPYLLSVVKVTQIGESAETFQIKFLEGLILFPGTVTRVASFSYADVETREVNMNCRILVVMNDTRNPQMEIPCVDVIGFCSAHQFDASVGDTKRIYNVDYLNGRQRFFSSRVVQPPSGIKAVDTEEEDESILKNWKSQATANSISILDENELLFPIVLIGNYSSQWINVKNPSQKPVVMQLIFNSGQVIDKCSTQEMLLQPLTSLVVNNSFSPTRYGFSIAKDAVTEAFIHPHETATLGPIIFHPSNRCEWRSSALIRNNLSGVEWLSLRGFGGSLSLGLHEGYDHVQSLEFNLNLSNRLNFSSSCSVGKIDSCFQPLTKEVYAKNMGDLPLEVLRIEVSGAGCGMDGFTVGNCTGFFLQPGESKRLHISYQSDFSAVAVQRDLELALASGVVVIPMKASVTICVLHSCKRLMFWMRVKKVTVALALAASLMCIVVFFMFPNVTAFAAQELKSGNSSFLLNSLHMRFNWKNGSQQKNGFVNASAREDPSSEHEKQAKSLLDKEPENRLASPLLSKPSSAENLDIQESIESQNLKVKVGKEKGKRQRKKKSCSASVLLFEVSSSQSGNSTPPSPLSPVTSLVTSLSPNMEKPVEAKSPFSQQSAKSSKCAKPSSSEVPSKCVQEKPILTKKAAGKAVLLPSATFPSAGKAAPAWKSTIAPHARAPGRKLQSQKSVEEKMDVEQKYTYDIWGDHLFGLPLTYYQTKEVTSKPLSSVENDYESFFVRGPQTLVKNPLLLPPVSDVESNE